MPIRYDRELNPSQHEAVLTTEGPLLVIAGAGGGKTRTLTYRVARLVEQGVDPHRILLLTFTRKAAEQMTERAASLLDDRCARVSGGTFHSFSHLLLRRHAERLGYSPRFVILDRADSEVLIETLKRDLVEKGVRGFPRKGTLAEIFGKCVNKDQEVSEVLAEELPHFLPVARDVERIHQAYIKAKADQDLMDFDDLLVHARMILATEPEVRKAVAASYSHIMVDEYQDTNLLQAEILRLVADGHDNVMAVGDDSQSIYAFRGARFENILQFPDIYAGTRIIRLEENYRSTQPILDVTNAIVRQAKKKYEKHLFTRKEGGSHPVLVRAADEYDQSEYVVREIVRLRDEGVALPDMAVLFRAGYQSFGLEVELVREGIPFVKYGGFKFMESAHVKDVLAHLRLVTHPTDRLAWTRALLLLPGIGQRTALGMTNDLCGGKKPCDVKGKSKWADSWKRLVNLLAALSAPGLPPARMGERVLEYYQPLLEDQYDNWPKRRKDLDQLVAIMERYTELEPFLSDMALDPPTTALDDGLATSAAGGRLVLSTVHSAKGLEWDAVFVIWTLDGKFPSVHAIRAQGDQMEEELRLLYVAATRARQRLYFIHPSQAFDRATDSFLSEPSRFLSALPRSILPRMRA